MAISDFYPFQENKKVTLEQWNELFAAVQDGTFFLADAPITTGVANLSQRTDALEQEMAVVSQIKARNCAKFQVAATALQSVITLPHAPIVDSELVFLNGVALTKTQVDADFVGDYSLDGTVITLILDVSSGIVDGDIISVSYQYEV